MKITNLLYTVLISTVLIFFPSLSLSQARLTAAPVRGATISSDGFCCSNGQVISSSQAQCKKRGQYYQTKAEALRHCRPNKIFCCSNGKVSEISPEQCKKNKGRAYSTEGEAKKKCKPKAIYCCLKGEISRMFPEDCKKRRGIAYATSSEAKAKCKTKTKPKVIYCCLKGKISRMFPEDCKKSRGIAYATSSEAKRKCKPENVYCCVKGKIKKVSPGDCKKNRGVIYKTATEAKRKCKPETVYCCLKGSIKKTSSTECKLKKGTRYKTEREARKNCGWCCAESKVFPTTPGVCKRKRGNYFISKIQADHQCKEQPQCCVEGKLVLYSQLECKRKKGIYYPSYIKAKRQCQVVVENLRPDVLPQPTIPGVIEPLKPNSIPDLLILRGGKAVVAANELTGPSLGVDVGTLTVLVDSSTPVSSPIPGNTSGVLYTVWRFEASDDEPINVEGLTVRRVGLGLPEDFDELRLYVDGVQQGSNKSINSATNSAGFSLAGAPIQVPAGGNVLVRVVGGMDANENAENALCVNSSEDVIAVGTLSGKNVSVAGSFAACGAYMYTSSRLPDDDSQPSDHLRPTISDPDYLRPRFPSSSTPVPPSPGLPPPPPEPDTFLLHPIEAIPFFNSKGYDSFQVNSVQFATVTDPVTNQTHLAAAIIFNKNVDLATVHENNNIRLLKQDEETTFWSDVSTQNNVLRIGPNFITWLSGAQLTNGKYKMHLRGTIESENGAFLDCDGDGVGEGGALPAYDSQIYQVNGLLQIDLKPNEVRDRLLDILTVSDTKSTPSPAQGDVLAERRQVVLQPSATGNIREKIVKDLNFLKPQPSEFQPVDLTTLIEVTEPSAGDFFSAGEQHEIIFVVKENLTTNCGQIVLYQNGVQVHVINQQFNIRTTPGQGGYHWNVPLHLAGGYQVVVRTCDNSDAGLGSPFLITSYASDLSVGSLSITPSPADTNDTIRLRATVTNIGRTTADNSRATLTVRDPDGGEHDFTISIPTLGFGSHHYIQKEFRVNRAGTYEITVNARVTLTTVLETNLANNEVSQSYTIAGVPDLVVCCDLFQMATTMHYGGPYGMVYNHGDGPSGATSVNIRVEGKGTVTKSIPALDPNRYHDVGAADWLWALGNKWLDFHIEVDPNDAVTERSEENNRRDGSFYIYQHTFGGGYYVLDMDTMYGCSGNGIRVSDQPYVVIGE